MYNSLNCNMQNLNSKLTRKEFTLRMVSIVANNKLDSLRESSPLSFTVKVPDHDVLQLLYCKSEDKFYQI